MSSKNNFKNDAIESIHASAKAPHKVDAIDKATMQQLDDSCLIKGSSARACEILTELPDDFLVDRADTPPQVRESF